MFIIRGPHKPLNLKGPVFLNEFVPKVPPRAVTTKDNAIGDNPAELMTIFDYKRDEPEPSSGPIKE